MSVHNGQAYLDESMRSVLGQTFADFEFIILDDGSEDNTWEMLKAYRQKDPRVVLMRNEQNIGLTRSLNKGLARARGEYVARQDADDISFRNRFETQVTFLNNRPEVVLVSSNVEFIDSNGCHFRQSRRTGDPDLVAWYLLFYNHVGGHGVVMFRRKAVLDLGGYAEEYPYSQDHELWLRMVQVGDIAVLPDVLFQWRNHDENISCKADVEQKRYSLNVTRQRISQIVGEEISLEEAESLKNFWLGEFRDGSELNKVHARLRQIYVGFLREQVTQDRIRPELSRRLRRLIAKQFFECSLRINIKQRLFLELKGSRYAFAWHPMSGLTWSIKETLLLPFYLFRALGKLASGF